VSPTRLVREKARSLCIPFLFILGFVGFWLLPGLFAGFVSRFLGPGMGAVLVALVLPAIVFSSLEVVFLLLGSLSYALIPTTIAAEGSDMFDAISRAYSYLFQRPLWFGW